MPAIRVNPTIKRITSERTHEENQERAYIAASRWGDRCLEARIESARRASKIHEKRTGRALRVTEADVLNEEMYEEISNLPTKYRRLTEHLRTSNADFNRRLLAYLSSQVAMRSAFGQAGSELWQNDQLVNAEMSQASPQHQQQQQQGVVLPLMTKQGSSHLKQSPYEVTPLDMRAGQNDFSMSMASTQRFTPLFQHPQSSHIGPFEAGDLVSPVSDMPQTTFTAGNATSSTRASSNCSFSRTNSATDLHDCQRQTSLPPVSHPEISCQSPRSTNQNTLWHLSSTLPLGSQQLFAGDPPCLGFKATTPLIAMPPSPAFENRRYSYNPNGNPWVHSQRTT